MLKINFFIKAINIFSFYFLCNNYNNNCSSTILYLNYMLSIIRNIYE